MIKFKLSPQNIANGKRWSYCDCAIALALKDLGFERVYVGEDPGRIFADGQDCEIPREMRLFIHGFDMKWEDEWVNKYQDREWELPLTLQVKV